MKVTRIEAHNVLGIRDIDLPLYGHHLYLVGGRNGAGKTSALRALLLAVCGKSGCDWPDEPVRNGEDEAWVRVYTDGSDKIFQKELKIERRWKKTPSGSFKEEFRVIGDDGFEAPEPQTLLKRLYKHRGFDPMSFLRMKSKDQAEELRRIVGLDFSDLNAKRKTAYDQRTILNRQAKELESKYTNLPHYSDAPTEPISVTQLQKEWKRRNEVNAANRSLRDKLDDAALECSTAETALKNRESDVAELEKMLEARRTALAKAKKDLTASRKAEKELQDKVSQLVDEELPRDRAPDSGQRVQEQAA